MCTFGVGPRTRSVDQVGLELTEIHRLLLGLKACITTVQLFFMILCVWVFAYMYVREASECLVPSENRRQH